MNLGIFFGAMDGGILQQLLGVELGQLVIWIAILATFCAVAIYVIDKLRASPAQHEPTVSELMSKFRELHSRGELSDAEFRTIRTTLGAQLQQELKDDDETGCDE